MTLATTLTQSDWLGRHSEEETLDSGRPQEKEDGQAKPAVGVTKSLDRWGSYCEAWIGTKVLRWLDTPRSALWCSLHYLHLVTPRHSSPMAANSPFSSAIKESVFEYSLPDREWKKYWVFQKFLKLLSAVDYQGLRDNNTLLATRSTFRFS